MFRDGYAGPIQKGRGKIEIQRQGVRHLASLFGGHARVADDQRHAERFFEMRPFAGQAAIAHVEAVVGGVDDDRVVRQSGLVQRLHQAADRGVDPADHAQVGAQVRLVFLPVFHRQKKRSRVMLVWRKSGRASKIAGSFSRGAGIATSSYMPSALCGQAKCEPGPPVAVLGVAGVEPEIQRERLVLRLPPHELDAAIDDQVRLVPQAAVGLLLVKRIAEDVFEFVEVIAGL
jgi:hypothetical protein